MEIDKQIEYGGEISPMLCKLNALTRYDGSAMFTQGETTVIASILGPTEGKLHSLQIDKAYVEAYYRSKSGLPTASDKLRERIIRNTCETALLAMLYPRTAITIQIFEMEDGGGLIACSVNAACLALLNSGLSMKMVVGSVHCIITADGDLILDPNRDQCAKARASLTFVFDSIDKNIVSAHTTGTFTIGEYNDAVFQCQQASNGIFKFYRESLRKFHKCC